MKIIADENIPCVEKAFSSLGEVVLLPGRDLRSAQVRDAEILLVRSVTRVDQNLLAGSRVRFVASATIGFDHVDRDYLAQNDIGFATASGSNATSAAEYVVSALLVLAERKGVSLAGKTVGIIGCGTGMIYRAACEYFSQPLDWQVSDALPVNISVDPGKLKDSAALLNAAVFSSYDVRNDDTRLRTLLALSPDARASAFDRLRKQYPVRREFSETGLQISHAGSESRLLRDLGFPVIEETVADLPG